MSPRAIFVLMILFLVLGSFAIFDPLHRQEKEESRQEREAHVVWLKGERLESLAVASKDGVVQLNCALKEGCPFDESGDWTISRPVNDTADPATVGALASTLLNLTQNNKVDFDADPDLKEYGLDAPQATMAIQLKGKKDLLFLKFGRSSPVSPNIYLSTSVEPRRLYLVPNYLPGMLTQEPFHWRNKRFFPRAQPQAITRLGWKDAKLEVRALRFTDHWRLEKPVAALAGQIMLEGLANTVSYAVAKSIFAPSSTVPEAKKLLRKPELAIEFAQGSEAHRLELFPKEANGPTGAKGANATAAKAKGPRELLAVVDGRGPVYAVEAAGFDRFHKDLLEYRLRSVIDEATRGRVNEVRFTFPREHRDVNVKLTEGKWTFTTGEKPSAELSSLRINAFLDSLRDSAYRAIVPAKGGSAEAKAYRAGPPDLYVELKANGAVLLEAKFLVKGQAVLTESEGDVHTLGQEFSKVLPVKMSDLTVAASQAAAPTAKGEANGHSNPAQ